MSDFVIPMTAMYLLYRIYIFCPLSLISSHPQFFFTCAECACPCPSQLSVQAILSARCVKSRLAPPDVMIRTANYVHCQVFAYGQAGAGKTSVLGMGRVFAGGLFQLAIAAVWEGLAELGPEYTVTIEVTFVELHNNQIWDLLNDKGGPGRLRQCPVNGPYLENVTCDLYAPHSAREFDVLRTASYTCHTAQVADLNLGQYT